MNVSNPGALVREVYEQFAIPAGSILQVESWRSAKNAGAEECRLLKPSRAAIEKARDRKVASPIVTKLSSLAIDRVTVSHSHIAIRVGAEEVRYVRQGSGEQQVIGVQKSEYIARCHPEAFVQAVC